jgi:hypothetical protein
VSDMVRRVARVLCSISGLNPDEHSLGKPQWQAYELAEVYAEVGDGVRGEAAYRGGV